MHKNIYIQLGLKCKSKKSCLKSKDMGNRIRSAAKLNCFHERIYTHILKNICIKNKTEKLLKKYRKHFCFLISTVWGGGVDRLKNIYNKNIYKKRGKKTVGYKKM